LNHRRFGQFGSIIEHNLTGDKDARWHRSGIVGSGPGQGAGQIRPQTTKRGSASARPTLGESNSGKGEDEKGTAKKEYPHNGPRMPVTGVYAVSRPRGRHFVVF
jgi:hypothetical protein